MNGDNRWGALGSGRRAGKTARLLAALETYRRDHPDAKVWVLPAEMTLPSIGALQMQGWMTAEEAADVANLQRELP